MNNQTTHIVSSLKQDLKNLTKKLVGENKIIVMPLVLDSDDYKKFNSTERLIIKSSVKYLEVNSQGEIFASLSFGAPVRTVPVLYVFNDLKAAKEFAKIERQRLLDIDANNIDKIKMDDLGHGYSI